MGVFRNSGYCYLLLKASDAAFFVGYSGVCGIILPCIQAQQPKNRKI
ncbi:Uncharacterised protein [Legionella pneumophila]|uniref:Uncharacterized protein n=1 Tax=Legionella pneumophila TaxID=446 RepID=A0A378K9Q4_LEGPN|nr:hypothetical protein LPC_1688 [Legionella pneumophila str. Corby]ADG25557.1 hypothetical protein lpa_03190 [Legionella pneumophila 2300/99 Alcoy]MDC7848959.1 hypothetical protein [Legionella pneumophila]WBA03390.1 hypothetical protein LpnA194_02284 [Legionella pneumophila]CZH06263.1 Uncharacterised protein [Legionella pneumophila]